jgi:hypothetical protein
MLRVMNNSTPTALSVSARRLGSVLEPLTGQVYFSPECHRNYEALGFGPSPSTNAGVAAPNMQAYFTSRGSVMGQVPGEVVTAAFGVFNPEIVVPAVAHGWATTDAATICAARDDGAIAQLTRLLGAEPDGIDRANTLLARAVEPLRPEGRPLYAGLRSLPVPSSSIGTLFRLGDMLREYRGDCHTAAWITAGLNATQIGLISELYWGMPPRSYSRSRGWTDEQFDVAEEQLRSRGILTADGSALTDAGTQFREGIEVTTDEQMRPVIEALGDDADELYALLAPWGATVRAGFGYPMAGPHDRAEETAGRSLVG